MGHAGLVLTRAKVDDASQLWRQQQSGSMMLDPVGRAAKRVRAG